MMKRTVFWLISSAIMALGAGQAEAGFIQVFNTGVDNSEHALAGGSLDPHFKVLETNSQAVVLSNLWPDWVPNYTDSAWIGRSNSPFPGVYGYYTYETSFDLTGHDPRTASLSGRWAADNAGSIELNGQDTSVSLPFDAFGWDRNNAPDLNAFTISGGFTSGVNKLDFIVDEPDGYDGLRIADLTLTASPLPVPSALTLAGVGAAGMLAYTWRRRGLAPA